MAAFGMNVDPHHGPIGGEPTNVRAAGNEWVRLVLDHRQPMSLYENYLEQADRHGLKPLVILARETFISADPDMNTWWEDARRYANALSKWVKAIHVGNETDHQHNDGCREVCSSWAMAPYQYSDLLRGVRDAWPDVSLGCAGQVSGDYRYLERVDLGPCDFVGVHPYTKDRDAIIHLTDEYRRFGKEVWVTEWNPHGVDGDPVEVTARVLEWARTADLGVFFWFCWSDRMVPPFGLLDGDGHPKPTLGAFVRASQGGSVEEERPWIGDGLQRKLDDIGWTPRGGQHTSSFPIVRAYTPTGKEAIIEWDEGKGEAVAYRKVG